MKLKGPLEAVPVQKKSCEEIIQGSSGIREWQLNPGNMRGSGLGRLADRTARTVADSAGLLAVGLHAGMRAGATGGHCWF